LGGAAISAVGKLERVTQNQVIARFRDELGYRYIGDWSDRDNSNIAAAVLAQGYQASEVASFFRLPSVQCEPCVAKAGKQTLSKNREADAGPLM
jgi:hypothetical protein